MKNIECILDWKKMDGLIPAIVQDNTTNTILMLGYMNREAIKKTQIDKRVWFFSRSRKRLWLKGEESKNYLNVVDITTDCDNDCICIKVNPVGTTCHTGQTSCFGETQPVPPIDELFSTIENRKETMPHGSYTAKLLQEGLEKICAKIEEESEEVVRASKQETKIRLVEETVDLLYHLFVLLTYKDISFGEIKKEVLKRKTPSP